MQRTENDLLEECRRGNRAAFQELVEKYQRRIVSLALGMVHNPDDAMEIAQETFVKAYENIGNFKGESSVYTWLYRIAVNKAIDFRRRQRRQSTVSFDNPRPEHEGQTFEETLQEERPFGPDQRAQAQQVGERVAEAIDELTPDHKAVILLREVEGLSYEEISRVMHCSKGTVMSRLHYARKRLQKKLRDLA
ncbi:MAG TPA: sigma-70 family RNA polymerase sigma factor [Terriglobales bacterium]|nr:sigma-70 family RNA polymerase sigma factor [Terriglobales bacterium]